MYPNELALLNKPDMQNKNNEKQKKEKNREKGIFKMNVEIF